MSIFEPNALNTQQTTLKNKYYTFAGKEDFVDDSQNPRLNTETDSVFAKSLVRIDNTYKHFIKLGLDGKIYNPSSIYGESRGNRFINKVCRDENKFKEVSSKVFDLYLSFLRTKNIAWLNNAEREML